MVNYFQPTIVNAQTLITLPFSYTIGSNELIVTLNGVVTTVGNEYVETSTTSITFSFPLTSTDVVTARVISSALLLDDLQDVNITSPANGDVLTYNTGTGTWINLPASGSPSTSVKSEITAAGLTNGIISVSFVAENQTTGLTDLKLEIFDPTNTPVITNVPLIEYFGTGAYYVQFNVGTATPGAYLAVVTSATFPTNYALKIFTVSSMMINTGGSVVQEATRNFGDPFTFRHVAQPGLGDVLITIFDSANNPLAVNQHMSEIPTTGIYNYPFSPTVVGLYTGVMSSVSASTRSVTEVIFRVPSTAGSGVVISNSVGVGTVKKKHHDPANC